MLDGGDVLLRVEAFANPNNRDAQAWLDGNQRPLRTAQTKVTRERGLPRGVTGVRLTQNRTAQAYAHAVVLLAADGLRLRVICPDLRDKRAQQLLRGALKRLHVLRPRGRR